MILYQHYEEALALLRSTDLVVQRTLIVIQKEMLSAVNSNLRPDYPFDMCVFFNAAAIAVAAHVGHKPNCELLATQSPRCVNLPNLEFEPWPSCLFVHSGLANRFIDTLQTQSSPNGVPFDMTFACTLAARAFTGLRMREIEQAVGHPPVAWADDFDTWLSGFSNNP